MVTQTSKRKLEKILSADFFLLLIGLLGHNIFFRVQDNFYREINELLPVYESMGIFRLSGTSFCAVIETSTMALLFLFAAIYLFNIEFRSAFIVLIYVVITGAGVLNMCYEYLQSMHPKYPDFFAVDMIVGYVAAILLILVFHRVTKSF